ncbi:UDP-N-acetylglucosamine 1-carboxyvinyltransferase [Candidatus Dependentiae bacterium]|nr:UDP-N-acetylglucosamine 1-carboxyvinyltransferase [Candidatus Dependentiae bacterium]
MSIVIGKQLFASHEWHTIEARYFSGKAEADYIAVEQSLELQGEVSLVGAKNAVLVIMASLILAEGKSVLKNVPCSADVIQMVTLLEELGAEVTFYPELNMLEVDTSFIRTFQVPAAIMKKMRASVLVMGPLLARFGRADIALPGGCLIGARPIDYHLKNFAKMGVQLEVEGEYLRAHVSHLKSATLILDYPSVGATENLLMLAVLVPGTTRIINAALEPEVNDLISILRSMGARITIHAPATIEIEGVSQLRPVEHTVIPDRLEAGSLLLAGAIAGGSLSLPQAVATDMEVFLLKLQEMGHHIEVGKNGIGISLIATRHPQAVSFRTSPYPGFPTDLQAPMMAALCLAQGKSEVHETVYENRFLHVRELQKMGAQIAVNGDRALITGVEELYGTNVIASDIRASCALVIAGLAAKGSTMITGIHHWRRGYQALEKKLVTLGAKIALMSSGE